jgi:hydroxymethylpyrimidine/phosphomethylpyrimidine kinase
LRHYQPPIIVLDPVMVAKSGYQLLAANAQSALLEELLPLATVVTPNLPEAETISGLKISNRAEMLRAAEKIMMLGAQAVLLKGGHLANSADDLLFDGKQERWLAGVHIETTNTHGTGCTLSSALAVNLANGYSLPEAAERSKKYVTEAIAHGLTIGGGHGPTHHFVNLYRKAGILE